MMFESGSPWKGDTALFRKIDRIKPIRRSSGYFFRRLEIEVRKIASSCKILPDTGKQQTNPIENWTALRLSADFSLGGESTERQLDV